MAHWPAPRGRMDDWSLSARPRAAASGKETNTTKPVTLTQARFFMDDKHRSIPTGKHRLVQNQDLRPLQMGCHATLPNNAARADPTGPTMLNGRIRPRSDARLATVDLDGGSGARRALRVGARRYVGNSCRNASAAALDLSTVARGRRAATPPASRYELPTSAFLLVDRDRQDDRAGPENGRVRVELAR